MTEILTESTRATALALIVMVAGVVAGFGSGVAAANPNDGPDIVVQNGESIQEAVNNASSGDVIAVEAGTYNETVRVNKTVTIKAKDPSNPPTIRYAPDQPKSNATFEIIASGVILSNLTIERIGHPDRVGNNSTAAIAVVPVDSNRPDCTFSISGCEDVTKDVTVKGSDIVGQFDDENESNAGFVVTDGINATGLVLDGDAHNITLRNSQVHGFSGGVGLVAEYGGTITDVEVKSNDIYNNTVFRNGTAQGVGFGVVRNTTDGYIDNVVLSDNNIENNHYGVRLAGNATNETLVDVDASNITVNYNDIVGNSEWGAMNNGTNTLDATNNWWGASDGPSGAGSGSGDAVSTGISYDPWLENSTA